MPRLRAFAAHRRRRWTMADACAALSALDVSLVFAVREGLHPQLPCRWRR